MLYDSTDQTVGDGQVKPPCKLQMQASGNRKGVIDQSKYHDSKRRGEAASSSSGRVIQTYGAAALAE